MNVVGIVGSPRKGRNTDVLVQAVLDGCERRGAAVEKIYLQELSIQPCRACRVQDGAGCTVRDGMDVVYRAFEEADGLVIGTPVYYSAVSSQIKLMIDRSYCLAGELTLPSGETVFQTAVQKQKKGLLIAVAGARPRAECIWATFGDWADEVNLEIIERVFVSHADAEPAPRDRPALLDRLRQHGETLCEAIAGEAGAPASG